MLATAITVKEISAFLSFFKDPIINKLSDLKDEVKHFLDDGLSGYLNSLRDKYLQTKTFLYRNEKINFYEVYFPIRLKYKNKIIKTDCEVNKLFETGNFITIIGNAGSGKTMLLKHLFLSSINSTYKIPIVIELRALNDFKGSITDYIYQVILQNKLSPNKKILERILLEGTCIFFMDGYDEIFSIRKEKITRDIDSFIDNIIKTVS
jgi:predicted NACHT family NTPase